MIHHHRLGCDRFGEASGTRRGSHEGIVGESNRFIIEEFVYIRATQFVIHFISNASTIVHFRNRISNCVPGDCVATADCTLDVASSTRGCAACIDGIAEGITNVVEYLIITIRKVYIAEIIRPIPPQ